MKYTVLSIRSTLSALLLCALVLGMMTAAPFSRAEEQKTASVIPWPVKTILNLDEAEQGRIIDAGAVRFLEFRMPNRDVWIPVTVRDVTVITNEADPERRPGGMRLNDFRQAFPWVEEGVHGLYVLTELGSGERIGELDKTFGEFYPNEEYFAPMMKPGHGIEREIDGMTYAGGASPTSILNFITLDWVDCVRIEQALLHWSIEYYLYRNPEFEEWYGFIPSDVLFYRYLEPTDERLVEVAESASKGTMTVKEYREQVYEKLISPEHRPVSFVYQQSNNANNNLPKLRDDILNASKDNVFVVQIYKKTVDNNGEFYKIAIEKSFRDPVTSRFYSKDIYTDEMVFSSAGEAPYLNSEDEYEFIAVSNRTNTSSISYNIKNMYVAEIVRKMCWNTITIGEIVELYEQLPVEYQVDYSYFDFANSPNVDPAWLANRPTPAPTPVPTPTPTPSPYAELRMGSRGQEVQDMKQRFYELGYFRTDNYSDQFNANTADTVRLFEKNNGLPVDGVADAVMLGVLFSDKAVGK